MTVDSNIIAVQPRDLGSEVERQYQLLLNSADYGLPLSSSSSWYNGLSTVELVARTIYGENTSYYDDQCAVGFALLNRFHGMDGQRYPSTMSGIITANGQFASITGSSSDTRNSRQPSTTSRGWANATYIACALVLSSYNISSVETVIDRPAYMDYQTQFVSFSYFMSYSRDGSNGIQYNMNGWKNVKDVIIPGVGTYTTLDDLDYAYRHGFSGESNIYFGYK